MEYHITIVRTEANPNFEEEVKKLEDDRRYRNGYNPDSQPQRDLVKNVLTCHLTEEQYKKIKAEVFKAFE